MPPVAGFFLSISVGVALALDASLMPPNYNMTEEGARLFANDYNTTGEIVFFESISASWNYNTNLTKHNAQKQVSKQRSLLTSRCLSASSCCRTNGRTGPGWIGGDKGEEDASPIRLLFRYSQSIFLLVALSFKKVKGHTREISLLHRPLDLVVTLNVHFYTCIWFLQILSTLPISAIVAV